MLFDQLLNRNVEQEKKDLNPVVEAELNRNKATVSSIMNDAIGERKPDPVTPKIQINDFRETPFAIAKEKDVLGSDKFFANNPYHFKTRSTVEPFTAWHFSYEPTNKVLRAKESDTTKEEFQRLNEL